SPGSGWRRRPRSSAPVSAADRESGRAEPRASGPTRPRRRPTTRRSSVPRPLPPFVLPRNAFPASGGEHRGDLSPMAQKPLELILARNFLTSLSTPAFLVDDSGALIFYNEAAGALLGISFEESGRMEANDWGHRLAPFDETGELSPIEEREMTK